MRGPGYVSRWYSRDDIPAIELELCIGDRLEFNRGTYKHWAICVTAYDDAHVIHRTGDSSDYFKGSFSSNGRRMGQICLESLVSVLCDNKVRINNSLDRKKQPQEAHVIVQCAVGAIDNENQLGAYDVMFNNCEHFVNWCRYNYKTSKQVNVWSTVTAVALGTASLVVTALSVGARILRG